MDKRYGRQGMISIDQVTREAQVARLDATAGRLASLYERRKVIELELETDLSGSQRRNRRAALAAINNAIEQFNVR